ncbi:hypothetical protein E5676_scaffold529G00290 [Cucumis melo var. makuwa]|uniref:NBS-LRR type resistance protein n=1 Tax=Cucumis melo var. makuwa TaxID=1194695 RepID=A0A5D3D681_CUCMM|nr:hypothetical protein E6C27_scaffold56G00870 [Cucumis melo var. makuwa]TYK19068.1 hypothetical protein E5676_scaffold529G00290 [Cucumis melo var. makuwa]
MSISLVIPSDAHISLVIPKDAHISLVIPKDTHSSLMILKDTHISLVILKDAHISLVILKDAHISLVIPKDTVPIRHNNRIQFTAPLNCIHTIYSRDFQTLAGAHATTIFPFASLDDGRKGRSTVEMEGRLARVHGMKRERASEVAQTKREGESVGCVRSDDRFGNPSAADRARMENRDAAADVGVARRTTKETETACWR